MTFEEFTAKLSPFFSPDEIARLNESGIVSANDALRESDEIWREMNREEDQNEYLACAGRDFVCSLLYDLAPSDDPDEYADEFQTEFGFSISRETAVALLKQFEIEW